MSSPSDSRWSAFSVRPPSASRTSVSSTVSNRNAASSSARTAPGASGLVERGVAAAPHRVHDLARPVGGLAALDEPGARARRAVRPATPGRGSRGVVAAGAGRSPNGTTAGAGSVIAAILTRVGGVSRQSRRPRSQSAPRIGLRPCGRAPGGARGGRRRSRGRLAGRRRTIAPGTSPASDGATDASPTTSRPPAARGTCRATAGRRGPRAPARRRAATGRDGRPRAGAAG